MFSAFQMSQQKIQQKLNVKVPVERVVNCFPKFPLQVSTIVQAVKLELRHGMGLAKGCVITCASSVLAYVCYDYVFLQPLPWPQSYWLVTDTVPYSTSSTGNDRPLAKHVLLSMACQSQVMSKYKLTAWTRTLKGQPRLKAIFGQCID